MSRDRTDVKLHREFYILSRNGRSRTSGRPVQCIVKKMTSSWHLVGMKDGRVLFSLTGPKHQLMMLEDERKFSSGSKAVV
jgi:hypothetical protein